MFAYAKQRYRPDKQVLFRFAPFAPPVSALTQQKEVGKSLASWGCSASNSHIAACMTALYLLRLSCHAERLAASTPASTAFNRCRQTRAPLEAIPPFSSSPAR